MHSDLIVLKQDYDMSEWHTNHELEPVVGHYTCHTLAEKYGIRGQSCYTVFVVAKENATYGCKYERCRAFFTCSLDDAIGHQTRHHFDHRPFVCIPPSGRPCDKRFHALIDLQNHQQHCS